MILCRACRRPLRTDESQALGIGPKCARMERQKDLFDASRNETIDRHAQKRAQSQLANTHEGTE